MLLEFHYYYSLLFTISALNLELVIGLSVGIPLFVIIVMIIAFLVYRRVKKRKASSRRTISDDK